MSGTRLTQAEGLEEPGPPTQPPGEEGGVQLLIEEEAHQPEMSKQTLVMLDHMLRMLKAIANISEGIQRRCLSVRIVLHRAAIGPPSFGINNLLFRISK